MSKADLWRQLNKEQQAYLEAIYACDQEEEVWRRKTSSSTPPSVWRWLPFNRSYAGLLPMKLRHLGHSENKAYSVLTALTDRGYIEKKEMQEKGSSYLAVQITRKGRALIRAVTGQPGRALSNFEKVFAQDVADLGLATLQEAYAAFGRRDHVTIEAWRPAVQNARTRQRQQRERDLKDGRVLEVVQCAWCSGPVEVKVYPGRRYTQPVRQVKLTYDKQDHWLKQYGCCPEHCEAIRGARVIIALEREP